MKALITGASSGIGKDMAIYLSECGFDLILCGRNRNALEKLQESLKTVVKIVIIDLADEKKAKDLYMVAKNVNIKSVHILTRMFLKDMVKKNKGYILNVASSAGLLRGGPLMSTYYATKSYVTSFTLAISEELRRNKSNVKIGVLCPGPVKTNFNNVAGVKFNMSSLSSRYVARYAIDKFLREGKTIIIPGFKVRFGLFFSRFLSIKSLVRITYKFQRRKK